MNICVIIPVHNEEKSIGSLISSLKSQGVTVIVIDDGSTDKSNIISKEAGASVIHHSSKQGKGCSLREGFDYAIQNGFDGVITMDGDGQHSVEDINRFLEKAMNSDAKVINGNRMENPKGMPLVRYLTNKFMSAMISIACRQKIPDTQCGFRYINCELLRDIDLHSKDFEIETEILMKASKKNLTIHSIPIKTIYRGEKSKINPFKDTLRFLCYFTKELFTHS